MKQLCSTRFWRSALAFVLALMMPFNAVAGTLTLPAAIKVVEEQAFENNTSVDKVVLPDGATTIKSQAFKNATALERAVIPESVTSIADDAFEGVEGLVVETARNSYAWNWAVAHDIAVEDPDSPFAVWYDQSIKTVYLNAASEECRIAFAVVDAALAEGVTVDWTLNKQSGSDIADLSIVYVDDNPMDVEVWTNQLHGEGSASWTLTATTSEGESWSEMIELTVEALPENMPTEIIMPETFVANVGETFQFMPSERLSYNGVIPEGVFWYYRIDISGDILGSEDVRYPIDGNHVGFSFTPDSPAEYHFTVFLNVGNYTISAPATLVIGDPESLKVSFEQKLSSLYLEGDADSSWIGWVSYDGMLSDPTIGSGKIVDYSIEKISGDDCVELYFDEWYVCEIWAKNITATGESVWRVSAKLSDGSTWSEDITVTVVNLPDTYPTEILCPDLTAYVGETFEFSWDMVSLNAELPEDAGVVTKHFRPVDMGNYQSYTPTENGFTFIPATAGDRMLELSYVIANYEITLSTVISVVEKPVVEFGGRVMDTVYATGSADGFLLGNLVPQVEVAQGDKFEWSIELKESSNETPAAEIGFNNIFGDAGPAVIGLMSLSGEAGTVTYAITVKHGENEYVYNYTLNVVEAPDTMPTGITVPETSYQIEVDELLSLSFFDIRFEGGQVPEGVSSNFNYAWNAEDTTGLTVKNGSGGVLNITGVTPGTYTINAYAAILNCEYTLPITIVVEASPLTFSLNFPTLYLEGNMAEQGIAAFNYLGELAEGEQIVTTVEKVSGDDGVELIVDDEAATFGNNIIATNITAAGQSVWLATATLPDGTQASEEFTITVTNMPENYPTEIIDPMFTGKVGELFEFDWNDIQFNGVLPEDGNQKLSSLGLYDVWGHETLEHTDNGFTFIPDHAGEWMLRVTVYTANHKLEIYPVIAVEGTNEMNIFHYFPTLYLEGNMEEVDIAEISVDTLLEDGEEIVYGVEYVSGDKCVDMSIVGISEDGLSALVLASNVTSVGQSTWLVSAELPDGTVKSEEITVNVVNMPEEFPTELIVDYPVRGEVGERFEFKPSERVSFNGEIPDDGNVSICALSYYGEIWEHPTHEAIDDGYNGAFAFTPDENARYGFSLYYYLGNHCLEHHGIIIIGDGNSSIGQIETDLTTTLFTGVSEPEETFWLGNAMLQRFHTLPGEEIAWNLELVDSSSEEPVVTLELGGTFENTLGVDVDACVSGETGWATYRLTASWDQSSWSEEFTINVVEQPEGLPEYIALEQSEFNVNVGDALKLEYSDIILGEGEIPEGVEPRYEYWIPDTLQEQQYVEWVDGGVWVEFEQNGRYWFEAAVRIGNYTLTAPITIVVGDGISDDVFMGYHQPMKVAYTGIGDDTYALSGWVEGYELLDGEQFHWELSVLEGEGLAEAYINAETDGESYEAPVIIRNVGEQTGAFVLRLSVTSDGGLELYQDFTIEILPLPENLPTAITVPYTEYQLHEGDSLEFLYSDIEFVDGEIPEGVEPAFEYWEFDRLEDIEWTENGLRVTFHEWGYYRGQAAAKIGNCTLTVPIVVKVGDDVGFMLSRPTTTHYINDKNFSWTGDLRLEGFRPFEGEYFEWDLERIDENEATPAEVYLENEYPDGMGIGVYLTNFTGETGSMTYRFIARSSHGEEWSIEHTINVEQMPDNFPTGISMPDGGFVNMPVGDILFAGYNMIEFVGGEVPEGADVYLEFWPDTVEEYGDPFLWNDNGFSSVLKKEGRYFFHAVAYVNGVEMIKPVYITVGDGVSDDLSFNTWQSMYTAFTNCEPAFAITAWIENHTMLPGEDYHWELEQLEGEDIAEAFIGGLMENNSRIDVYLDGTGEKTGTVSFRLSVTSEGGLAYSHDFSIEIVELPEGLPTEIILPEYVYEINEGDTLEFLYSDISFGEGVVPEGIEPVFEYWHLDQVEDHEWTENGLKVTYNERGFYHGQASARYGNYMLTADINIKVGDDVGIMFDHVTTNHYINNGSNWVGEIMLEGFYRLEDEHIEWDLERIDQNEATPAEVYFDEEYEDGFVTGVYLKNFTGETGSMTYRFIARSTHGGEWSIEHTINVLPMPDNFPTGITMPNDGVLYLEPGSTVVAERSMVEFVGGEVPEDAEVYIDIWPGTVEDFGEPFDWNENGFTSVLNREGRYFFHVAAYVNGVEMITRVDIIVGDGVSDDVKLNFFRTAQVQYPNPNPEDANWLTSVALENYAMFEGEQLHWSAELLEGDESLASLQIEPWDEAGADIRLNNFSGECGSMKWLISVQNENGNSWSEEIYFEIAATPDYLPTGINMPNDGVVYLNPGDTLVASYDMIEFVDGAPSETDIVYFEFWSDSVEQFADSFEWNDNGFTAVLNEDGRYSFRAIAFVNGIVLVKEVVVLVGSGVSNTAWINVNQAFDTAYAGIDEDIYALSVDVQNYFLLDGESYSWQLEQVNDGEYPIHAYINNYYDDDRGVNVHVTNAHATGIAEYRLRVTTNMGLELTHDFTINVVDLPEGLPTELNVQPNHFFNVGERFYFNSDNVEFGEGYIPENADLRSEIHEVQYLQQLDNWNEWSNGHEQCGFEVDLSQEGIYRFLAVKAIGNYVLRAPVTIYVGNVMEDFLYSIDRYPQVFNSIDENGQAIDWVQTRFREINHWLLWEENIDWSIEVINDNGNLPAELYLNDEYQGELVTEVRARNTNGDTGSIQYRVTATLESGLRFAYESSVEFIETPNNLPTEMTGVDDVYYVELGERFEFTHDQIGYAGGEVPEGVGVTTNISMDSWYEGFEWTDNGFAVTFTKDDRYAFDVSIQIANHVLAKTVVIVAGTGAQEDADLSVYQPVNIAFANVDVTAFILDANLHNYLRLPDEELVWTIEQVSESEPAANVYVSDTFDGGLVAHVHANGFTDHVGYTEYRLVVSNANGEIASRNFGLQVIDKPENLPTALDVQTEYYFEVGDTFTFCVNDIQFADGEVPEGFEVLNGIWDHENIPGMQWDDESGSFTVTFFEDGRYVFYVEKVIGNYSIAQDVTVLVGTGVPDDAYIYASQDIHSMRAYMGAQVHLGSFDVQLYELLEGESYSWTLEKISDENVSPVTLYIDGTYDNDRGVNVWAKDVTGETGSVTYRLTVTTEQGLNLSHDITIEVTEGRDDLPTGISVPRDHMTVYANNVIVLRRSDIEFVDGVVLDDDMVWSDYWDLECLGDQSYGWDLDNNTLAIHFTELGTYELLAVKAIGGVEFYQPITIHVVERGENDPYVDWTQDVHTIYTGLDEYSTWIGWGVLENYEVTEENTVSWSFERISEDGDRPVDLYIEVYDDGLHADMRYTNARRPGSVTYRLIAETSDGFMDSREFTVVVEELPENLPTAINMQTLYELEVGDTFEFDSSEAVFADGEIPENASQRNHVRNMDAFYELEDFEWTENGFRATMNQEGRYIFTYGMQIGNYTVQQDVAVVVGNAYPADAQLTSHIHSATLFNDPEITDSWIGNFALDGYELASNERVVWSLDRIDQNEGTPANVDFHSIMREGTVARLQVSDLSGETGEMTFRLTARTNAGFELSEEFTLSFVEKPENKPSDIKVPAEPIMLSVGDFFSISAADIGFADGDVPTNVDPYVEYFVSYEVMDLPDFEWLEEAIQFTVPADGRYCFDVNVYFGGYLYTKTVYLNVGTGVSENIAFSGMQKIQTIYLGLDGQESDHLAWYSVLDHILLPGEAYHWNFEQIEGDGIVDLRLEVDENAQNNASVYINSTSGDTGSVKYRVSVTSEAGIEYSAELPITIEHAPEGLPTELILPMDDYHFEVGETVEFLFKDILPGEGTIPENALVLEEIWGMNEIPGCEEIRESDDPEGDGYRITFDRDGRYEVYFVIKIENLQIVQRVIITVGSGISEDAWVEYWGTERTIYTGLEHIGWALDAEVRNYHRADDEEFHWNLEHIGGPELEIERNHEAGNTWLGVWYDFVYTGEETGDSVYLLTLDTDGGFHAEQEFVFHVVDRPDGLPSDIIVPEEEIYLNVGDYYAARYEDLYLTDDGNVPEGAEVRHEFHIDGTLTEYHGFQWTDDGFEVTFTEEGRYHYYAVIKVNGIEYRKEVRIIVGDGISDDVRLGFFYGFNGMHYINDNVQWIGDIWIENYNLFDGEEVHWDVVCTDEEHKVEEVFIDPVWDGGLAAGVRMDRFTGETGITRFTVYVNTDGGYTDSFDIEINLVEKPEDFPEEIIVYQEDIYLEIGETYHARMDDFYEFPEGTVIPEGESMGHEFWPEELENYHTFEWVDGGFDVTFTENGRHHFYVNVAVNGVDFTKEIRIHVGTGIADDADMIFDQVFVQQFASDRTQWIGDAHLENYFRFDNEEIHWDIEYLDEGEPLANVFIDPVWDGGLWAGVRVNDFRGTGEMNLALNVYIDGNFSWSKQFTLMILDQPDNLPSDIVVEREEIRLDIGETFEARMSHLFEGFTDDGEIRYDIAEFFHEFYVDEQITNYHSFEWVDDGFNVTFFEPGRYHFYVAVTVNGFEYAKEIRLIVDSGVSEDAHLDFMQNAYTAYAAEDGNAWIGCVALNNYQVFENEDVHWWVERIDQNDCNPLYAYVDNLWEERNGANIHVDGFTGETGTVEFRIWFQSEYGFETYTDFTLEVVELPQNMPTILHVPSDNMTFNIGDEFVIHDYDLTPGEGEVPEGASFHYEYWDIYGTFYNQEVWENEHNGGFTVRFHNEGRYELTVALLINTYKLTRTIRITVGDGMDDGIHMSLNHAIDPVYTGTEGACRIGSAYIENFNVFEEEDIVWTIEPQNADETAVADVFISSYHERNLGVNFAVENANTVGETTYVIKAVLPTGMVLAEEITLHVEELPEGLPTELFVPAEEIHLMIGDTFTMMHSEVQFGEGSIPDNAAVQIELWPDENLENLPGFEYFHDEETNDDGISVTFEEPGEYTVTVAAWIGNYMLFKDVKLHVTEPWKMALLVGTANQSEEEYVAAMKVLETYGEEHVIVETYADNFIDNVDQTIDQIVSFAERDDVKAIIVAQSVPGTAEGFRRVNEMREDVLLISGIPAESFAEVAAQADIMMYSDEAAQAQPIMDTLEAWGVDTLVHYSFDRHMQLEAVAARYDQLVSIGDELGIEVIHVDMPDPTTAGVEAAQHFVAADVAEKAAQYAEQKVAFFSTNCGVQAALQMAVLEQDNAYYPQPCCPSPYHGFPYSLGLDLDLSGNPKAALREIANVLAEYDAAGRFSTWASPVNMGIIEVAAKYAAGYAEGAITSQNDGDMLRRLFNAKFGNPTVNSTEFDNGYAIMLEPVDFTRYAGVYESKIAVLTGTINQGEEEFVAAQKLVNAYGEQRVIVDYYPDEFYTEEGYETIVSQITGFAEDPNVSAIIVMQSVPGTLEGFRQVRQMRDDVLLISGVPQQDMGEMSAAADLMLYSNEPAQAFSIMDTCEKWGIEVFVHYSFDRHLALESVAARRDLLAQKAAELGVQFVEIPMPDPAAAGVENASAFIRENVPAVMKSYEGQKVAFFATNCGVQAALQEAVLNESNAYYPQPCCPSPYHGFGASLGLDLNLSGNPKQALRDIASVLNSRDALDRFSTWAVPVNMGIMEVAGKYAITYANDELSRKHDEDTLYRLIRNTLGEANVSNEFGNGYSLLLNPVDFRDYEGVYAGKIAIVTGSENQGQEEITAARRVMDIYGEERVILETYPDDFMKYQEDVSAQIAALAEDPNVGAIIVMQSVPGTLEGFRRVRDVRDDILLISGLPQESFDEMSGMADMMMLADEVLQAEPIMDKCEEWDIDVFVHLSFERHMELETVSERHRLITERAAELGIEVIDFDILDPAFNDFEDALDSVRDAVSEIMAQYEGQKVAFFSTVCGVQGTLQSAVLENENAYYPQPCCPSPYHGFQESLGQALDLYDSKAAMRQVANALYERGAAHRFSTWASPVNMSIIDVAAEYAIRYVDGAITATNDGELLRELYTRRYRDANVNDSGFHNCYTISFEAANFMDHVSTDEMIQVWVAETMIDFTAEQFENFKRENEQYAHANINLRSVGEGDAADFMIEDAYYGADVYGFAQDQLSRLYNSLALSYVTEENAQIIRESNDAGSVEAATMHHDLFAYPMTADNGYFLYYDKSVVTDPTDLDAIVADCEAAGKTFHMELTSGWYQPAFFFGAGCQLTYEVNGETGEFCGYHADYTSENGVKALKSMIKVASSPAFSNDTDPGALTDMAAVISGTWLAMDVQKLLGENYAAVKLPEIDGYQMSSFGGYKLLGVKPQNTESKQALCDAFAMYLTSEEVQKARFDEAEWGPSNLNAQQSEAVQNNVALRALMDQMQYAVPQGQYPDEYWSATEAFGERLLNGEFNDMTDEELLEVLQDFQNEATDFIVIIA